MCYVVLSLLRLYEQPIRVLCYDLILLARRVSRKIHFTAVSVHFICLVTSDSFQPHEQQHTRLPCQWWSLLKFMSIESVMPSNHLILCHTLFCLQSFPAAGSFPMSQFFTSGGQSIRVSASASVLPMNIQYWFPLGLSGWIALQSKRLSWVFPNTTVQKHQFFGAQLFLWSNSHICTWLLEKLYFE